MTESYSFSESFTYSHANQLAANVATDLSRLRRFYGSPSVEDIGNYEAELATYLKYDYLDNVIYGFKRNGKLVEALRYHVLQGGVLVNDDPGKLRPGIDISNSHFTSFLSQNARWSNLSLAEKTAFKSKLPFQRVGGVEPSLETGSWSQGLSYATGGRGIARSTIVR